MTIKKSLTKEQLLQIAANAVNASSPMGMGFLHYQEKEYKPSDMESCFRRTGVQIDYFEGRMVKLSLFPDSDGLFTIPERDPSTEYQSWARKYPTYKSLFESVGVK